METGRGSFVEATPLFMAVHHAAYLVSADVMNVQRSAWIMAAAGVILFAPHASAQGNAQDLAPTIDVVGPAEWPVGETFPLDVALGPDCSATTNAAPPRTFGITLELPEGIAVSGPDVVEMPAWTCAGVGGNMTASFQVTVGTDVPGLKLLAGHVQLTPADALPTRSVIAVFTFRVAYDPGVEASTNQVSKDVDVPSLGLPAAFLALLAVLVLRRR